MIMRLCRIVFAVAIISFAPPSVAGPYYGGLLLEYVQDFKQYPPTAKARDADGLVIFPDRLRDDLETSTRPVIFVSETAPPSHRAAPPAAWSLGAASDDSVRPKLQEPYIDMVVAMSGQCNTLKIAGRDFACRAVRYFHGLRGRAYFTIVVDDPTDDSHVISFSGDDARREVDNLYELTIDRMMFNSKDRPKVDGVRVARVELSTGICKQLGDFAASQISNISCTAVDKNGKKYELQFESDGSPITVQKIAQYPLSLEKYRAKRREQLECRRKANAAKILPRDQTAYIIGCLEADSQKPTPAADQ
jgi:hypothetical protein